MNKNKNAGSSQHADSQDCRLTRRGFLRGSGTALIGGAAILSGVGLFAADSQAADKLGAEGNLTLLRMARDICPHDSLEDKYYRRVMQPLAEQAATDPELFGLLDQGLVTLERESRARYGKPYLQLSAEADRVAVLKALEDSAFFQKIKGDLMMGIYNNPDLWPRFGYGGSAWEYGGYINRGFDEIDWL